MELAEQAREHRHWLPLPSPAFRSEAGVLLRSAFGPDAVFHEGQLEAISALVEHRSRLLVVMRTGWGKSIVYFIAARMLRDRGAGPAFLVSPLLSLMRNQEHMAARIGVRALRLDSSNVESWESIVDELRNGRCDLLMVSPERLANQNFRTSILPSIQQGIGMMVVDEAHCISDWGHDFRPDYRRIVQIVRVLPSTVSVLATTATANDRVVADIEHQLSGSLQVIRGPLARSSLRIQTMHRASKSERLAWLATHLPSLPGSGIIYCLTVRDADLVSRWLRSQGIDVAPYHADLPPETRETTERQLLANAVKGVAATVALGMGFDKPDLGFVVHFQRPGSVVSYYQQIGRAGRAGQDAFTVLMHGSEDDQIQEYFIKSAFPGAGNLQQIVDLLENTDGLTIGQIERSINLPRKRIEQCLKLLEVEGAVRNDDRIFFRTPAAWRPDLERVERVTELRGLELDRMREFLTTDQCLMEFVARELDDPSATRCGRCANCAGDIVPRWSDPEMVASAERFLARSWLTIPPRRFLPPGALPERERRKLDEGLHVEPGLALCSYLDSGWGDLVRDGKYSDGRFDDRLLNAAAEAIEASWAPDPETWWMTAVPSMRHPELVFGFAERLARKLGLPCVAALTKVQETPEQKLMQNGSQQFENILRAFRVEPALVRTGPVILVDDMVDSGWTMTNCGARLRKAGSGPVYPFALASFRRGV